MNFEYTEEQHAFAESVRRFAEANLANGRLERAHDPRFPFDVAQLLAKQGLLGITFDEADGGLGGSLMDSVIAIEQIASVCPRSADVVQAGNFGPIRTFAEYATLEQKQRFLPDLLAGRTVISLGMSEPGAGSAVTELKTSARKDGDHYVVNGTKVFGTHSPDASVFLVYLRFGPGVGGIGSVLVERGTPGFTIGKPSPFMSGEEWCQLYFEECRIPARTCCSDRADSRSKYRASTWSASATQQGRLRSGDTPLSLRASMHPCASNSAAHSASFRGFNGSLPIWP